MQCRLKNILLSFSFLITFLISHSLVNAQVAEQQFRNFYKSDDPDIRIEAGLQIAEHYIKSSLPDSALHVLSELKLIPQLLERPGDQGDAYRHESQALYMKGELPESISAMKEAIKLYFIANDSSSVAYSYALLGFNEFKSGLYKEAYEDIKKSLDIAEKIKDYKSLIKGYYYMGILEFDLEKNNEKAMNNFGKAMALAKQLGDSTSYYSIWNGQTHILRQNGEHQTVINNTLEIAAYHLRNKMMREYNVDLHNLGYTYAVMKQWDKSLEYHHQAMNLSIKLQDKLSILEQKYTIGTVQLEASRYRESIKTYLETLDMAEKMNNSQYINLVSAGLAEAYEKIRDFESAYHYFKKHKALNDSIESQETKQQLQELQVQFESEQKDKELALVRAENLLTGEKISRANNLRNILILILVGLVILASGLYNRYQFKQKTAKKLQEKNAIIEFEKERAEKSEQEKQNFLASMSHEIRTPLNAIIGISELLDQENLNTKNKQYTVALKDSSAHLMNLINNVMDISKMESGSLDLAAQIFETDQWVNSIINMFSHLAVQKGLDFEIQHELPQLLYADHGKIKQILINLTGNAIKFSGRGKVSLFLSVENVEGQAFLIAEVRDSGPGIHESKLPFLFSKFSNIAENDSRREISSGLGLHISQEIAKVMGGEILVSSMFGMGSTFTLSIPVEIPLSRQTVGIDSNKNNLISTPFNKELKFLIAEDNAYNQLVIKDLLEKHIPGSSITIVDNGNDILPAIDKNKFDLLLLDLLMPGKHGIEVLTGIRNSKKSNVSAIPVIILSASTTQSEVKRAMNAGANAFVNKPIQIQTLINTISTVLKDTVKTQNHEASELNTKINTSVLSTFTDNDPARIHAETYKFHSYLQNSLLPDVRSKWLSVPDEELRRNLHDLRPQLLFFGFDSLANVIYEKEIQLKTDSPTVDRTAFLSNLETQLEQVLLVLSKQS
jgi:signal transduction histidine kinase/CheY-like chemotaxis protein